MDIKVFIKKALMHISEGENETNRHIKLIFTENCIFALKIVTLNKRDLWI